MSKIEIGKLKGFCREALVKEGMKEEYAKIVAEVLSETDAFGTNSHGTKNLHNYIKKARIGGLDIHGEPEIVAEGSAFAPDGPPSVQSSQRRKIASIREYDRRGKPCEA